jgi:hypothetical protein
VKRWVAILISGLVSLGSLAQGKLDSLQNQLSVPDSVLSASVNKIDSIQQTFNHRADSLKGNFQWSIAKTDSLQLSWRSKMDSLQALQLPTDHLQHRLDSLSKAKLQSVNKLTSKLDSLKTGTLAKLNSLELPPDLKKPVQELSNRIDQYSVTSGNIPSLEVPGYSLPRLGDKGFNSSISDATSSLSIPGLDLPTENIRAISKTAEGYTKDIKAISSGNLDEVKQLPTAIENKAAELGGVESIAKQGEDLKQMVNVQDEEAMKQQLMEQAREVAIDHFAGKEEALKGAMEKMSKYKQKYSSVSSLSDLTKRPPNPLKQKPFVERLVPGISFQYQRKNDYLADVFLYSGYRHTERIVSGLGWNQRFALNRNNTAWNGQAAIYGPRAFGEYKIGRGFIFHIEGEAMNTFVPFSLRNNQDVGKREWVWGVMTGLKTEYGIYKSLRGTVLLQYNLFDPKHKSPYVDRLNTRIGLEYLLKNRRKL